MESEQDWEASMDNWLNNAAAAKKFLEQMLTTAEREVTPIQALMAFIVGVITVAEVMDMPAQKRDDLYASFCDNLKSDKRILS